MSILPSKIKFIFFLNKKIDTEREFGINLVSNYRNLKIQASNIFSFLDFLFCLKQAIDESPHTNEKRYNSFAPER